MKITLLGGGSEIGASSLHVEMNGTRLLIDAGMRMHQDDPMPSLGMLEELGGIDGVLVTHAHADHIGALPVVRMMYPDVPIYATPPTLDLMRVMMQDSYRLLDMRCKQEQRLMPYAEADMQALLATALAFPASGGLRIGGVDIELWQAGHILGAVMIGLSGGGERLLVTGDISFRAGRTIQGAKVPHAFRPNVIVMESTYGNRAHTDRSMEERRLAEQVAVVVAGGGFALIPAFALGRSQEILLLLQDFMDQGLIPAFPIYVDGMVTAICRIYRSYPQYLKGPLAYRIRRNDDVFLSEGRCIAVKDVKHRESLLQGKPGCIVASSGMLIGGASQWYAERLVGGEKNAIFITGYQDEESPGRKLLALAESGSRTLELSGVVHPVRCRVDKFGLSAHADAMEMSRFIDQLKPERTLLVHGDDEARHELARRLDPAFSPLPADNGHIYEWDFTRSKGERARMAAGSDGGQSGLDGWIGELLLLRHEDGEPYVVLCIGVHGKMRTLTCRTLRKPSTFRIAPADVAESLGRWNGSMEELEPIAEEVLAFSRPWLQALTWERVGTPAVLSLAELCPVIGAETIGHKLAAALAMLALPESHAVRDVRDERREVRYALDEVAIAALRDLTLPVRGLRMDPTAAMNAVRELLSGHARFARCGGEGIDGGSGGGSGGGYADASLVIFFDFPDAVGEEERRGIAADVLTKTGWPVKFSESVRQDQLVQLARHLVAAPMVLNPSIHLHTKQLVVDCPNPPANWRDVREHFRKETGYDLVLKGSAQTGGPASPATAAAGDGIWKPRSGRKPMEVNLAQQEVRRWAEETAVSIYKASLHQAPSGKVMELHFISPQVAVRYGKEMAGLAERIGMSVTYARNPKQNEIASAVMDRIPSEWSVVKSPSLRTDKGQVLVKTRNAAALDPATVAAAADDILRLTGYVLIVE